MKMMKTIVVAVSLMIASVTGIGNTVVASEPVKIIQEENKVVDMWYLYSNEDGTFWLDYGKEMDTIMHVDYDSLAEWKVDKDELEYGFKMIGVYDKDEEIVLGVKEVEYIAHEDVPEEVKKSIADNIIWEIERLIDEAGQLRKNMDRLDAILN